MWLRVFSATALVHFHVLIGINWQRGIWVDGNEEKAGIGLSRINERHYFAADKKTYIYEICLISHMQVMDY